MTDIKEFYTQEFGCVISSAIDKYFYTMLNTRLDDKIRLVYSKMEEVDRADQIKHPYARECLKFLGIRKGIEIVISSDIPARGSGLGTSSSTTVGLFHVLYRYQPPVYGMDEKYFKEDLASGAYTIEHNTLGFPCGKQDQYAAAFGGFNYIQFNPDETVEVCPIKISLQKKKELEDSLILFYTGLDRKSVNVSSSIIKKIPENMISLQCMKSQTLNLKNILESNFSIESFGRELSLAWSYKKDFEVSTPEIDKIYKKGKEAGAYGGKLCGAGKGGFFMFCCDPERQEKLKDSLPNLRSLKIKFDETGSTILHNSWKKI